LKVGKVPGRAVKGLQDEIRELRASSFAHVFSLVFSEMRTAFDDSIDKYPGDGWDDLRI
jgi:hypothetical protein